MKPRISAPRGFTFIELVASLCLISLVMALIFPAFISARERARQTSCRSNLQQIGQALHLYSQDYDGHLPPTDQDLWPALRYTKNLNVFACPGEPAESRRRYHAGEEGKTPEGRPILYSSYRFQGGLTNDGPAETPLAMDWAGWHSGEADLLRLDGSIRIAHGPALSAVGTGHRPLPSP